MEDNDNVKEIPQQQQKGPRTRASIRKAIEGELTEAKVKEVKAKLKKLVEDLAAAKRVVAAKEAEIESLFEDYADILPE